MQRGLAPSTKAASPLGLVNHCACRTFHSSFGYMYSFLNTKLPRLFSYISLCWPFQSGSGPLLALSGLSHTKTPPDSAVSLDETALPSPDQGVESILSPFLTIPPFYHHEKNMASGSTGTRTPQQRDPTLSECQTRSEVPMPFCSTS